MDEKARAFILDRLIPYIQRNEGRGFDMARYITVPNDKPGGISWRNWGYLGCGTVACIAGASSILLGIRCANRSDYWGKVGTAIGLTPEEAMGLFERFKVRGYGDKCQWPAEFALALEAAKTKKEEADVACNLLLKIAAEGPGCLHPQPQTETVEIAVEDSEAAQRR
jgi:hypothetical protein